jgi:S1-C subfamily serine protease
MKRIYKNNNNLIIKTIIFLLISLSTCLNLSFSEEFDIGLIEKVKHGVVSIKVKSNYSAYGYIGESYGTGFIIEKSKGLILTNTHIVQPGTVNSFEIKFFNGKEIEAKLLYYDPWQDFAIIKTDIKEIPEDATELKFNPGSYSLNQSVLMVGNNQGKDFSIQTGNISSLYESMGVFPNQSLRISLNVKGGSSGSPVVDKNGLVIALNHSGDETSAIALPINYVSDALQMINKNSEPVRKHIGAITEFYSLDHAVKYTNLPKDKILNYIKQYPNSFNRTLRVKFIMKDAPAENKLQVGDIIWAINGTEIGPNLYLLDKIMNDSPTNKVTLSVYRLGKLLEIEVPLYNLQENKIKKMIIFGGATFYEADDFIRLIYGAPAKSVFITNIEYGTSFDQQFPYTQISDSNYLLRAINILAFSENPIVTLDDLVKSIPGLIKKKYFNVGYKNFATAWHSYTGLYYFDQTPTIADIKYNTLDSKPIILSFDNQTLEWKQEDLLPS